MPGPCPLQTIALLTRALVMVVVVSLALVRCGEGPPPSLSEDRQSEQLSDGVIDAGCAFVFAVDDELVSIAEQSAARWSVATDCDVSVVDGATTAVRLAASVPMGEGGKEVPGWTSDDRTLVLIHARLDPGRRYRTLNHELGHALGGLHTASHGTLSGEPGRSDVIDAEALETVCAVLPCGTTSPEAP